MNADAVKRIRVVLVEDHPMFREQVANVINRDMGMIVCGETDNSADAMNIIRDTKPDIAIVDLTLRGSSGIQLVKNLRACSIWLPVLILSMHDEKIHAERLLWAGARGFVCKSETSSELKKAIRKVLDGEIYLSESMTAEALKKLTSPHAARHGKGGVSVLSDRELEVFRLLGMNYTSREIADMIGCSASTVNSCRFHIREKLGIKTTLELYKEASRWLEEQEKNSSRGD